MEAADDIIDFVEFVGNQSDILAERVLATNTLLLAPTLRATNNRLKEPISINHIADFRKKAEFDID